MNEIEIGDIFIINWKRLKSIYPSVRQCNFPDREFVIHDFSNSKMSVYYLDNRTNKKCKCKQCSTQNQLKCIGISDIIVTQKRISINRQNKLKSIGI